MFGDFWKKKKREQFKCSTCGELHNALPALAFNTPDNYHELSEKAKSELAEISSDFCVITHPDQTDYFIRAVLTIPINDECNDLSYGIWVSVSEKSFLDYQLNFKKDHEETIYFGMICNVIPEYEESTMYLHANVVTRNGGIRPEIFPHECEHQLLSDWENGISMKEALKRVDAMMSKIK